MSNQFTPTSQRLPSMSLSHTELPPLQISEKGRDLISLCRKFKFVLASGPRKSGKTISSEIAILDHCWRVPNANFCMAAISQSVSVDGGVWEELVNVTLPKYMAFSGMKWVRKPYNASPSKKPTFIVTNQYEGHAKIQLDSLPNEDEVEKRFKGKSYSGLYVAELSNFRRRKTFDIWSECLRGQLWKDEDFLFLGDTNPSDEGEASWIYQVWWTLRQMTEAEILKKFGKDARAVTSLQRKLAVIEMNLDDNPFLSDDAKQEVIGRYLHDTDLYDRYVLGLWVAASADALFHETFRDTVHVGGEIETPVNRNPEILVPHNNTYMLGTGWDTGEGTNSAAVIVEKWYKPMPDGSELLVFVILDELVVVGRSHNLPDFTLDFLDKMRWWEELMGRKFHWRHKSDRSVFDRTEPVENRTFQLLINEASDGEIALEAADRSPGSHVRRVDLFKRLLFEGRILINRDLCPWTIRMCKSIRASKNNRNAVAKGDKLKHCFDSLLYYIEGECAEELETTVFESYAKKNKSENGVLSIRS